MRKRLLSICLSALVGMGTLTNIDVKAYTSSKSVSSENYSWNSVQIEGGGFIPGIIFNKTQKDLIYARTDMGGIYRWLPESKSWKPLTDWISFDDWNYLGCESLATDPIEPNKVYAVVGTYTNDWTNQNGAILISDNYGDSWDLVELPFKVGGNMPGRSMGERLVIDPNNNNILYLGTRSGNGLWRSIDSGETWNKVSGFTAVGSYADDYFKDQIGVAWITFDKNSGTTNNATKDIYVGVADKSNSIYRSIDGGITWEAVAGQPTGYLPHHGEITSDGMLYITYSDGEGPYNGEKGEVYKYNTKTGEWKDISPIKSSSKDNYFGYGGLAIDAQNEKNIVVSALNSWWPDTQFYRSTDGGETWTPIWEWGWYPNRNMYYNMDISSCPWLDFGNEDDMVDGAKLGWMVGDVEIDPFNSDRMMYGTGATLYSTEDLTKWDSKEKMTIKPTAKGIEETAVNALIAPPGEVEVVSGLGDICGFRHDDITSVTKSIMTSPTFDTTTDLDYAELNPNYMVRVGYAGDGVQHFGYSIDRGKTWNSGTGTIIGEAGGGRIAISADGGVVVWSPTGTGVPVSVSKNNGASWIACSGIPSGAFISSDRVNPNKFYGFYDGNFYVSTDSGLTFNKTSATGLPSSISSNFKAMPGVEGDIWIAGGTDGNSGLWHSVDSGSTFTKLTNVDIADTIGFGKAAPGSNYMALYTSAKIDGTRGIYRSDDAGASWIRINTDSQQFGCTNTTITGDPDVYGRVYLGTNGRGIQYGDINTSGGGDVNPPVVDKDSTLSTTSGNFIIGSLADIKIGINLNGNTVDYLSNGSIKLTLNSDYEISDNTVVLKNSYLNSLAEGINTITFKFSSGKDAQYKLNVIKSEEQDPVNNTTRLELVSYTQAASTSSISMAYKIVNEGESELNLSNVKLRYYFYMTEDKVQTFTCEEASIVMTESPWYQNLNQNVKGTFIKMDNPTNNANYYLEVSFTGGTLSGKNSLNLGFRFGNSDWSMHDQSDDYSYGVKENTTFYLDDKLVSGIEPISNEDSDITIIDLAKIASKYNMKSSDINWDSSYDLNKDNIIDIYDLVIVARKIK